MQELVIQQHEVTEPYPAAFVPLDVLPPAVESGGRGRRRSRLAAVLAALAVLTGLVVFSTLGERGPDRASVPSECVSKPATSALPSEVSLEPRRKSPARSRSPRKPPHRAEQPRRRRAVPRTRRPDARAPRTASATRESTLPPRNAAPSPVAKPPGRDPAPPKPGFRAEFF